MGVKFFWWSNRGQNVLELKIFVEEFFGVQNFWGVKFFWGDNFFLESELEINKTFSKKSLLKSRNSELKMGPSRQRSKSDK